MKTSMSKIVSLITFLIMFMGCQDIPTELGESEKNSIIQEVKAEYNKFIAAANTHDVAAMMHSQWNSEDFLYASDGKMIKGFDAMSNVVNSIHSNPELQSYSIELNEVMTRVISREAVMVISQGFLNNFPTNEGPKSIKFVETMLMEKVNDKWVITVGHESAQEDLENI